MKKNDSVVFALWCNRAVMLAVVALVPVMPVLLRWYNTVRILSVQQNTALLVGFYCCAPVVLLALWQLEKLLRNIRREQVFIWENVRYIRRVGICCAVVSALCLAAAFFYPPLVFLTVIMAFLWPVLNVVRQVLRAAIEIREENELTI